MPVLSRINCTTLYGTGLIINNCALIIKFNYYVHGLPDYTNVHNKKGKLGFKIGKENHLYILKD